MATEESVIRERLKEIERLMQKLENERSSLYSLLHTQAAKGRESEITNKRSYGRIYNEEKIKEVVRRKKAGISSKEIMLTLVLDGTSINSSTLRSYLTRMAQSGHLRRDPKTRRWQLARSDADQK